MADTSISLLYDVEDLYEELLAPLGVSKAQYKKHGMKKGLSFKAKAEVKIPMDLLMMGEVNPDYKGPVIEKIHEDHNFLVLSKPAAVHGHSQNYTDQNTVHTFLRSENCLPECGGADHGLLYRLDKETSGVFIFAKHEEAYQEIREGFNELAKEKIYVAVVEGKLETTGEQVHFFKAAGEKGSKQVESADGKEGKLSVLKTKYNSDKDVSFVKVSLETGLRHQIRAQLSFMGHPIVGDVLYGGSEADRLFLHALKYAFDWEGQPMSFEDKRALLFDQFFNLNTCL